ncbi:MAG: ABC transporter ATP-binding protein [Deltaproteobacteria bacterium]|nr:ABC transporter ATP-binding protein [Deltaproteobacteria bacterium]
MNAAIKVSRLYYAYRDTRVLDSVSFSVSPGNCFVIIGPNGSGKTTLMKVLAGLFSAKQGSVEILGKDISGYPKKALARKIAYVPQQPVGDLPFLVEDIVLFGRAPHLGMFGLESKKDYDLARMAMSFTEVEHLAGRRMDQLSGGEQQRVFLARAVCQDPEIILLDEPTASLDIAHQMRVMDLMEKMKIEKNITVVMVSHDINLAAMYADTLLLLHHGKALCCGPPEDVLTYERLEAVYGCPLLVDKSPLGGLPRISTVPGRYIDDSRDTILNGRIKNAGTENRAC